MSNPEVMSDRPELTGLLSETRWLRALALKLCSDADRADDLVQETWLAALEHPPHGGQSLRGWLATVVRNKLGDRARSDSRRDAREQSVARDEALASTADVVDRAATHRDVVQAVLDLDEPYRTTILLRYFESLPPRKIAARMQVPVATVDSRLVRGHAKLRASLDRRFGRRTWLLALLPLARDASMLAPAATGVLAMNVVLKISIPIALIAVALWWGLAESEPNSAAHTHALPIDDAIAASAPEAAAVPLDETRVESVRAPIDLLPTADPVAAVTTPTVAADRIVKGRVLDSLGRGLAGITLGIEGATVDASHETRSGASGSFDIAAPASASAIVARDPEWTTVLAGYTNILPTSSTNVVVAPRIEIAGRVVDESGSAIEGAEISVLQPENLGADFGFALDLSARRTWRTQSDRNGAFVLADVPGIDGTRLQLTAGGFPARIEPAPLATSRALVLVLTRESNPHATIEGRVVDAEGRAVASARVSAGSRVASVDDRGRFVLDVSNVGPKVRVVALARGFLPAAEELDKDDPDGWRDEIVLTLSSTPLSIRGRVAAVHDAPPIPVPGARVWISDPTLFGRLDGDTATVESLLAREDHPFWVFVEADEHGRFEIGGLLERDYWVRAADPRTLEFGSKEVVPAGSTNVEIDVANPVFERVRGRVVTSDGAAVAGARVHLERRALEVQVDGGTRDEWMQREPVITDAKGAFEFASVPHADTTLVVRSDEILSALMPVTRETNPDDVVIRVSLRLHVQVELDPPIDRARELRILDENEQPIVVRVIRAERSHTDLFAKIVDGRSEVLSVSDAARTLVLFLEPGNEVARIPLHLLPRTLNVVRY